MAKRTWGQGSDSEQVWAYDWRSVERFHLLLSWSKGDSHMELGWTPPTAWNQAQQSLAQISWSQVDQQTIEQGIYCYILLRSGWFVTQLYCGNTWLTHCRFPVSYHLSLYIFSPFSSVFYQRIFFQKILLAYSWFTMLYQFQVTVKWINYTYTYSYQNISV